MLYEWNHFPVGYDPFITNTSKVLLVTTNTSNNTIKDKINNLSKDTNQTYINFKLIIIIMFLNYLIFYLSIFHIYIIFSYSLQFNSIHIRSSKVLNSIKTKYQSNFILYVSKHRASYGQFLDTVPFKKISNTKFDELKNNLDMKTLIKSQDENTSKTGKELRKDRERDLIEAKKNIPVFDYSVSLPQRKFTNEQIALIIDILNKSYGNKTREELSEKERLGMINWLEFDNIACDIYPDYDNDDGKIRKKLISWVRFHQEKREIKFEYDSWIWSPKNKK